MRFAAIFALLAAGALAEEHYSFSPAVGSGSGSTYTITGKGRITAVRVWELYGNHIYGIQVRYGGIWSDVAGYTYNQPLEIELHEGEKIVQMSGKYAHYIQSLVIVTSEGRSLQAGQPSGHSFNTYPAHEEAELRFLSGRYHGGLTSITTHWAVVDDGDH